MTSSEGRRVDPTGRPSYGMARASAQDRHRATLAVRALTVLGASGAVVGSGYLTAALVPATAASATAGTSTGTGGSDLTVNPSLAPAAPAASATGTAPKVKPVPHSLAARAARHGGRLKSGKKSAPKHTTQQLAVAPAVTLPAAPATTQPATNQPATNQPPPRPVVNSGGS